MPIYEFRCRECGRSEDNTTREPHPCSCGGLLKRVFHCNVPKGFQPHFNHAVGAHVTSQRHFEDTLKRRAEENSIATGTDHNYSPIDGRDMVAAASFLGVNDDGLEETARRKHDAAKGAG